MDQKIKFALIGLIALAVLSAVAALFFWNANVGLSRDYASLGDAYKKLDKQDKELLSTLDSIRQERQSLIDRFETAQRETDNVSRQRDELKQKYDAVNKEKETLAKKIDELAKGSVPMVEVGQANAPVSEDSYWAGILKAKAGLELQIQSLQGNVRALKAKFDDVDRDKSGMQLQISKLDQDNQDLQRQLDYNSKLVDSLSQDLVREKLDKKAIQAQLKTFKDENLYLRQQVKETKQLKGILEQKLQRIEDDKLALKARVATMNTDLQNSSMQMEQMERRVAGLPAQSPSQTAIAAAPNKSSVELQPIVVKPQTQSGTQLMSEGKIVSINWNNNFVILDLGQTQGVRVGQTLNVYQSGKRVASLEIIEVRNDISAADIVQVGEGAQLKVGDAVK